MSTVSSLNEFELENISIDRQSNLGEEDRVSYCSQTSVVSVEKSKSTKSNVRAKESSPDKNQEKESKNSILQTICIGLIAVIALYGFLAYIISKETSKRSEPDQPNLTPSGVSGCGPDSFMIRDGVCDELTNTEMCLYDGGDCCLDVDKKDTTLCLSCICQLTIDNKLITNAYENLGLKKSRQTDLFAQALLSISHVTTNVITKEVCTMVCLDPELDDKVNGWIYNFDSKECTCVWLKSTTCRKEDIVISHDFVGLANDIDTEAYVQLAKFLDCSCFQMDQKFIEPVVSLENPFQQDPVDTMSAYHCREQCMNTKDCNSFSWQYDKSFGSCEMFPEDPGPTKTLKAEFKTGWLSGDLNCSESEIITDRTTSSSDLQCLCQEGEWELIEGLYILLVNQYVPFQEAKSMCLTLGGKLFEPMNLGINNAVALRFSEKFPDADGGSENRLGMHIGITDSLVEDNFRTLTKPEVPLTFTNWAPAEPNNAGNEDCAALVTHPDISFNNIGVWNDGQCDWKLSFACERDDPCKC